MDETITVTDLDARRKLKADLTRFNCRVHQPDDPPVFTPEPQPTMQSVLWRWRDLSPLLDRLGREIDLVATGPRRTLRLANPGLTYGTTNTFWASIQVILPGEIAGAHRHSASAFRFIMRGRGATSTVNGEQAPFNEGDLVMTPAWTWHDHEHRGDEPMIWLDVLDISLMKYLQATFFEDYSAPTQPLADVPDRSVRWYGSGLMGPVDDAATSGANPLLVYPREMAEASVARAAGLPPDPFDDTILEYRNPVTGGPAMPTMGMRLQRLRPGFRGRARRHTGSKLYYVVRGEGVTIIDGARFDWTTGDFFAIAPWAWHEHWNVSPQEEAMLFQANDLPVMKALGYYREEEMVANGGHQALE